MMDLYRKAKRGVDKQLAREGFVSSDANHMAINLCEMDHGWIGHRLVLDKAGAAKLRTKIDEWLGA